MGEEEAVGKAVRPSATAEAAHKRFIPNSVDDNVGMGAKGSAGESCNPTPLGWIFRRSTVPTLEHKLHETSFESFVLFLFASFDCGR